MQGGTAIAGLSPVVIPVFVSNLGCPHRCIFCDQRQFSPPMKPEEIPALVDSFLAGCRHPDRRRRVLGFFGGSFTGLAPDLLDAYLAVTRDLIDRGRIHAAKASTRPDMVSPEVLDLLRRAGFEELEIGVQSMDDTVLEASMRGHTSGDSTRAAELIRASGMRLGIQLMPGLPREDAAGFRLTVDASLRMNPDTARIYPVVVLRGTKLEDLFMRGEYRPLSLDEALKRALYAKIRLESRGCTILRMGLPQAPGLNVAAGPFHPSFGFLVRAKAYEMMAARAVGTLGQGCIIAVNPRDVPELVGYRRETVQRYGFLYSFQETLPRGTIRANAASESTCIQLQDILEYIL